jgi:hypothetical protein
MTDDTDKVHKALEARLVKRIEALEEMVAKPGRRPKSS